MLITPFYVLIKTEKDEEIIPCADLDSAQYLTRSLKRYNFKNAELQILKEVKQEDDN